MAFFVTGSGNWRRLPGMRLRLGSGLTHDAANKAGGCSVYSSKQRCSISRNSTYDTNQTNMKSAQGTLRSLSSDIGKNATYTLGQLTGTNGSGNARTIRPSTKTRLMPLPSQQGELGIERGANARGHQPLRRHAEGSGDIQQRFGFPAVWQLLQSTDAAITDWSEREQDQRQSGHRKRFATIRTASRHIGNTMQGCRAGSSVRYCWRCQRDHGRSSTAEQTNALMYGLSWTATPSGYGSGRPMEAESAFQRRCLGRQFKSNPLAGLEFFRLRLGARN
jgi:hypothetical protein